MAEYTATFDLLEKPFLPYNVDMFLNRFLRRVGGENALDLVNVFILTIVAFVLVAELFFIPAQPQTFDGWTHITTIKKFAQALAQGNFPVSWVDSIANYGFPLGQIAHQTTAYIGAFFYAISQNSLLAYNLVLLAGAVLSTLLVYSFLRLHFRQWPSLGGAMLFNFAPYRITNIYVRGALPEFFAGVFIPIILIGMNLLLKQRKARGALLVTVGTALLALTHPMMVLIGFCLVLFYALHLMWPVREKARLITFFLLSVIFGIVLASYYILPLFLEVKYFYYGQMRTTNNAFEFMKSDQFFVERWNYQDPHSSGTRENRLQLGSIEFIALIFTGISLVFLVNKKHVKPEEKTQINFMLWMLAAFVGITFLTSPYSQFLYKNIPLLAAIQHPWRMLTALQFLPPIFLAYMLSNISVEWRQKIDALLVVILIAFLRFPQLYGKNYVQFPESRYVFAIVNLHSTNMNPVWTGVSWDYPVHQQKYEVIEGDGSVESAKVLFTKREYKIQANTPVRMADYTFYFPGWTLLIDGQQQPIEYQDPSYRGVITYRLPAGPHTVKLEYNDTKIRSAGKVLSLTGLVVLAILCVAVTKNKRFRDLCGMVDL